MVESLVDNVAAMLSSYCGRASGDGPLQACTHDHTGDAEALIAMVRRSSGAELLRGLLETSQGNALSPELVRITIGKLEQSEKPPAR